MVSTTIGRPRGGFAVSCAIAASTTLSCVTPLLHPLRATNGPVFELASSATIDAGRRGDCDDQGCRDGDDHAVGLDSLQVSGGYSRVFARRFGVMGGVYAPAAKLYDSPAALWSFFTVQNEHASAGVGPDIGLGGAAITVGGEVQPWGYAPLHPRFGAYGRWFWPYAPSSDPSGVDARVRTWDAGGRLRFGPIYLQYAISTQPQGTATSSDEQRYAQTRHILTFGLTLDSETVRVFTDLGSGPEFRPRLGP